MWLTIPSKPPAMAKCRMAPALSPQQRRALHFRMLEDVLSVAVRVTALEGICVVTACPEVSALAGRYGAAILNELAPLGHRRAVAFAALHFQQRGIGQMMILPGDVPLMTPRDIDLVLAAHDGGRAMTFVPDHRGQGSNCIIMAPEAAPALMIGCGRFDAHVQAAADFGYQPRSVDNANIRRDIDTPGDLLALVLHGGHTRSGDYIIGAGIMRPNDQADLSSAALIAS